MRFHRGGRGRSSRNIAAGVTLGVSLCPSACHGSSSVAKKARPESIKLRPAIAPACPSNIRRIAAI